MSHAKLLALLLPPESYAPAPGSQLHTELAAEAATLDAAQTSANNAAQAVTPYFAAELLTDWERVCGITPPAGAPYQQRLQAVLAKLAETGGLSIPYFTRLAESMGYSISITELAPFCAGVNRAGDPIHDPDVQWCWRVDVSGQSVSYAFHAGISRAGEPLLAFGDAVLETVLNELKPAHTFVYFTYQE